MATVSSSALASASASASVSAFAPASATIGPNRAARILADATTLAAPRPVRVITFNTAVGNPKIKTPQGLFPDLPFYREIIDGSPEAPILCAQEVGPAQLNRMRSLARNGNFTVIATYAHPGQANMMLIPKRFEILDSEHKTYGFGHLRGFANAIKGWFTGKGSPLWSQMFEPRKYTRVRLRDRESGREFTVFNTHTSYYGPLKYEHNKQLFAAAREARGAGPVVVAGDLNTRAASNDTGDPWDSNARVRAEMGAFQDMGPPGPAGSRPNIDWVLADGFASLDSRIYTGDALALPGSPSAELVSDHYAEEDTLRFS